MSVLGTHLYQHTSWCCCERVHSASVNFLEESFSAFARSMMVDLWVHLPTPHWVVSSFWPKPAWPPCPAHHIHPVLPWAMVFCCCFPGWKKSSKGNILLMWKKWYKMSEALKDIKIKFKNCFEQWKKHLDRCITSNGEYFEGDWRLNMLRINTHFL